MKINTERIKNIIKNKAFHRKILDFLVIKSRWAMLALILLLFAYIGYLWKVYIDKYAWSEERKQEYIRSKGNEELLDRENFDELVREAEARKVEYEKTIEGVTDIFRLK